MTTEETMKRHVIAAVAALFFAPPTFAQTEGDPCSQYGYAARATMTARQNEMPIDSLMALANDAAAAGEHIRQLVLDPYSEPAYQTPENKQQAIDAFANAAMLACYKWISE
jgi:hypothetical protein